MTLGWFVLFLPVAMCVVAGAGVFGPMPAGWFSWIGGVVFVFFGVLLLMVRVPAYRMTVRHADRLFWATLLTSGLVFLGLFVVVSRYGPSAAIYVIRGETPPLETLFGAYREKLPFRALLPPLMTALGGVVAVQDWGTRWSKWTALVAAAALVSTMAVYETRFIILWPALYVVLGTYPNGVLTQGFRKRGFAVAMGVIFLVFMIFGNIRTAISAADVKAFAIANEIAEPFSDMPLPGIWATIYLFGGIGRGLANDSTIPLVHWELPPKLFPGPLQYLGGNPFRNISPRFETQAFSIDAWHTYGLEFGAFGATVLILIAFTLLIVMIHTLRERLAVTGSVGVAFLGMLWFMVRIALFPVGDYFLDFGAWMELLFLLILGWIAGFKILRSETE